MIPDSIMWNSSRMGLPTLYHILNPPALSFTSINAQNSTSEIHDIVRARLHHVEDISKVLELFSLALQKQVVDSTLG